MPPIAVNADWQTVEAWGPRDEGNRVFGGNVKLKIRDGNEPKNYEIQHEWTRQFAKYGNRGLRVLNRADVLRFKAEGIQVTLLTGSYIDRERRKQRSQMYYVFEPGAQWPCGCFAKNGDIPIIKEDRDDDGPYLEI